jgi:8-oxo-dGTP pyrophosphatase MutT (NUDIX family)
LKICPLFDRLLSKQEIPGGKVDEPDETLLHAAVRELKEETGLRATRIVRKVTEFGWSEVSKRTGKHNNWRKHVFEVEVESLEDVVLDPIEHQRFLWATEEEVQEDKAGDVIFTYITPPNKVVKLEAFRKRREGAEC